MERMALSVLQTVLSASEDLALRIQKHLQENRGFPPKRGRLVTINPNGIEFA